jgi:ABC-2 type transport system ATP-binding protein
VSTVVVADAGKRYVKYDDVPMLVTRALRPGRRTRRSTLWALRHVDAVVEAGESVGVIGRNGSGKTTLLRLLAGVTAPTEGSVRVRGRVAPLIAVGVGFHPELTGRENVFVNGTVLGLARREIERRFDEIVSFAELGESIDTPVKFYSSGMFLRLGFSVAVAAEPDVLLVDEVLAVGDVAFQEKCVERMQEVRRSGTTVVVVSHNLNAVQLLCPRTLVLDRGALRFDGASADAISRYHELLAATAAEGDATDAVVEHAALLGADGRPTAHVTTGDDVVVALDVRFTTAVDAPRFGISVTSESGVVVYADHVAGQGRWEAGGRARFRGRVSCALATGTYLVQASLWTHEGDRALSAPASLRCFVAGRHTVVGVADLGLTVTAEAEPVSRHG